MFKFILLLIVSFLFCCWGATYAQMNLVPNPIFNIKNGCPDGVGEVDSAAGWSSFLNSPDYFNTCASPSSFVSIPNKFFGYQLPFLGDAYCGFYTLSFTANFREILGCQLISPLVTGQKYYVNFKVNRAYGQVTGNASNKIGARFSTVSYDAITNPVPINNFAHVYTDSIITDTLNWITIQGSIIADSAYKFIALGNFFDDAHTLSLLNGNAYYYISGVCVTIDSLGCDFTVGLDKTISKNRFKIYPNPANSVLKMQFYDNGENNLFIYNNTGELVCKRNNPLGNKSLDIDVSKWQNGIYFIKIQNDQNIQSYKISVLH